LASPGRTTATDGCGKMGLFAQPSHQTAVWSAILFRGDVNL